MGTKTASVIGGGSTITVGNNSTFTTNGVMYYKDGTDTYDTVKTFSAVSQIVSAEKFLTACKINKTALINKSKANEAFETACENVGAIKRCFAKDVLILTNNNERQENE